MSLLSLISDLYSSLAVSDVHAEAPPAEPEPEQQEPEPEQKEEEQEEEQEQEQQEEEEEEPEDQMPALLEGTWPQLIPKDDSAAALFAVSDIRGRGHLRESVRAC
jgi:FtsZ-interacting cell division protein YlmF